MSQSTCSEIFVTYSVYLLSETNVQAVVMNTDCDVETSTGHISLPSEFSVLLQSVILCE